MKFKFFCGTIFCILFSSITYAKTILPSVYRWKTTHGTPVVFYQAMEVPMLDINMAFYAGSAYDQNQFGLSALTSELIDQGNGQFSADQIADQFAEVGSQFATESSRDSIVLSLRTLSDSAALTQSIKNFTRILSQPNFPENAFQQKKNQQLLLIKQREESGDYIADKTFYQTLYQNHPYAHPIDGTIHTVEKIQLQDVKHFYQKYFVAKNAVLVLVGAINPAQAKKIAEEITLHLPVGKKAISIPEAKSLNEEMNIEVPMHLTQAVLRMGQTGINQHDKDYFPLLVGNYILGGGSLVSQLALEVREKRGLTYGVYSQFVPLRGQGPFLISLSTKKEQSHEAEQLIRDTLTNFIQKGPSVAELNAAKQYLKGSFPQSIASNQNMAHVLLKIAFYELPHDYLETYLQNIEAVTAKDIQIAFKQHLNPEHLLSVQVGKT